MQTTDLLRDNQDSQESQIIFDKLQNLPPISWFLNKCQTEHQKDHWMAQKYDHIQLLHELQTYFAGQVSHLQTLGSEGLMELNHIEILQALTVCWLRFYDFTYLGWSAIKNGALVLADNKKLDRLDKEAILIILEVQTPGALLAALITLECEREFQNCQEYTEIRPREIYEAYLLQKKINSLRELPEQPDLTKGQEAKIKKFLRRSEQFAKESKPEALTNVCLTLCEAAIVHGKPRTLATAIKNYHAADADFFNTFGTDHHPRNGKKGSNWNNGENLLTR